MQLGCSFNQWMQWMSLFFLLSYSIFEEIIVFKHGISFKVELSERSITLIICLGESRVWNINTRDRERKRENIKTHYTWLPLDEGKIWTSHGRLFSFRIQARKRQRIRFVCNIWWPLRPWCCKLFAEPSFSQHLETGKATFLLLHHFDHILIWQILYTVLKFLVVSSLIRIEVSSLLHDYIKTLTQNNMVHI